MAMEQLPHVLCRSIADRLPIKSLVNFRCAYKELYDVPDRLIKSRIKKSIEEPKIVLLENFLDFEQCGPDLLRPRFRHNEDVDIVAASIPQVVLHYSSGPQFLGSCNGLMCFQVDPRVILLVNPVLKEVLLVPISPPRQEEHNDRLLSGSGILTSESWSTAWLGPDRMVLEKKEWSATGLGLDQVTGLYKFVVISREPGPKVFDLCTRKWRGIRSRPQLIPRGAGIFVGEILFWRPSSYDQDRMVSFDVANEKFFLLGCSRYPSTLFDLEGRLGLAYIDRAGHVHIWELNIVDSTKMWTKKCEIDTILLVRERGYDRACHVDEAFYVLGTRNRKIIFKVGDGLCSYDPKSREVEGVYPSGLLSSKVPYCIRGSLESLSRFDV